ncbi:Uncharacterized conserved protein [Halomicrobium zhouii]|uniref:Uncharacterized conserved protein n=1 Tax=Halomicrobium zhouii TaxID=767519 RepID=A0A1I6K1U8_9EURY|nr:DUF2249 domain-containing protein [Halomicrobium zhouii]SFR85147.1 Uncharacterized conserved protein [Halomicrobium zhouii]
MPETTLDLRDVPPAERHPMIHSAFEALGSGEALEIVNDHEPKPLFYEFQAEVDAFDAENYDCERAEPGKFVATLPKV